MHRVLFSLFDGKITVYTYSVCIVIGLLAGALVFRWLCKRLKMSDTSYDFYSFLAIFTVVVGFVAAYVFQDVYNVLAGRGSNIVKDMQALFAGEGFRMSGGITFMGGLLGGAVFFIICTLCCKDKKVRSEFPLLADIAAPVILVAHGFGRIGCFFGGCCYGKVTNSVFGINYPVNDVWQPRFPTQLYEAAFCFIAFGLMLLLIPRISFVAVSVTGAVLHNLVQLSVYCALAGTAQLFGYAPYLCLLGAVSGAIVGLAVTYTLKSLPVRILPQDRDKGGIK